MFSMVWILHDKTGIHHPLSELWFAVEWSLDWTWVPADSQQFHLDPSPAEGDRDPLHQAPSPTISR